MPPAVAFGALAYCSVPAGATTAAMVVMVTLGCAACVLCSPASVTATGKTDPGEVVADEFAGQAVAFVGVPLVATRSLDGWEGLVIAACGFFAFRVIDILKPGPIKRLERLPAGWGILADDLAAGLVAAILVCVVTAIVVRG